MPDFKNIKHFTETYPSATCDDISKVEAELSLVIPEVYKYFLLETNGAVCALATLYDTESLIEMNRTYEVQEYASGYIAIGNDGGGYQLLMVAEKSSEEFRLVSDSVGMPSDSDCKDIFDDWLIHSDGNPWRNKNR